MDSPYTDLSIIPATPSLIEGLDHCQRIMSALQVVDRMDVVMKKYGCQYDIIPSPTHTSSLRKSLMMSLNEEMSQLQQLCHPPVVHIKIGCGDPRCGNPDCRMH